MQRKSFASNGGVGGSLPWANLGETSDSGVDFSINYNKVVNSDFQLSARHVHLRPFRGEGDGRA